jgi:hypothetical protein
LGTFAFRCVVIDPRRIACGLTDDGHFDAWLDILRPPFLELVEVTATEVTGVFDAVFLAPLEEHFESMLVIFVGAVSDFGPVVSQVFVDSLLR